MSLSQRSEEIPVAYNEKLTVPETLTPQHKFFPTTALIIGMFQGFLRLRLRNDMRHIFFRT